MLRKSTHTHTHCTTNTRGSNKIPERKEKQHNKPVLKSNYGSNNLTTMVKVCETMASSKFTDEPLL
jgi:hypothetical protein